MRVQASWVASSLGRGTVWKWSYTQIEDQSGLPSTRRASPAITPQCCAGSMPTRSWRQPWGMNSPNFMGVLSVHARGIRDRSPCHPANPARPGRGKSPHRVPVSCRGEHLRSGYLVRRPVPRRPPRRAPRRRRVRHRRAAHRDAARRRSPIADPDIEERLATHDLRLRVTTDKHEAYAGAEFVVVATPTNYDERTNYFDTSSVEQVVGDVVSINPTRHRGHQVDRPGRVHRGPARSAWEPTPSSSPRSSCARDGPCTTTCTRRGSSSATRARAGSGSPPCWPRPRSTTCPCC